MASALELQNSRTRRARIRDEVYVGAILLGGAIAVGGALLAALLWFLRLSYWVSLTD